MSHCPKCNSNDIRRSRTRNRWERLRKSITDKRPFRCRKCQWRGWLPMTLADMEQALGRRHTAPDPPNLRGTVLARSNPRHTLDIKTLDRFHSDVDKDTH